MQQLKSNTAQKLGFLLLTICTGLLGVHRLYLKQWRGIAYLPVLYMGTGLTASTYTAVKIFGYGEILLVAGAYFFDIYLVATNRICSTSIGGRLSFIILGLAAALLLTMVIGVCVIVSGAVPFTRI